jgi:RNA polymerase-binding transcription factor DksA
MPLKHCIKCGKVICQARAKFYTPPFSDMCNECRDRELFKEKVGVDLKK